MRDDPDTVELPAAMLEEMARIIVLWANVEVKLKELAYWAAKIPNKQGRLLAKAVRGKQYPELIRDLLLVEGVSIDIKKQVHEAKSLGDDLESAQKNRDALAHGAWIKRSDREMPLLQVVEGTWQPDPSKPDIKRAIKPEGAEVTIKDLQQMAAFVASVRVRVMEFERAVRTAAARQ